MSREEALATAIAHLGTAIMAMVVENDGPWSAWAAAEAAKFIAESGVGNP